MIPRTAFALPGSAIAAGRAATLVLGLGVLGLAAAVAATSHAPADLAMSLADVLGLAFPVAYAALLTTALFCWLRQRTAANPGFWTVAGLQAASGIATLALTFTLLGISLGIGALADREITPETVQGLVSDLTRRFSLAFLTTVIGLPTAAALRALLALTAQHRRQAEGVV